MFLQRGIQEGGFLLLLVGVIVNRFLSLNSVCDLCGCFQALLSLQQREAISLTSGCGPRELALFPFPPLSLASIKHPGEVLVLHSLSSLFRRLSPLSNLLCLCRNRKVRGHGLYQPGQGALAALLPLDHCLARKTVLEVSSIAGLCCRSLHGTSEG